MVQTTFGDRKQHEKHTDPSLVLAPGVEPTCLNRIAGSDQDICLLRHSSHSSPIESIQSHTCLFARWSRLAHLAGRRRPEEDAVRTELQQGGGDPQFLRGVLVQGLSAAMLFTPGCLRSHEANPVSFAGPDREV